MRILMLGALRSIGAISTLRSQYGPKVCGALPPPGTNVAAVTSAPEVGRAIAAAGIWAPFNSAQLAASVGSAAASASKAGIVSRSRWDVA